MTSRRILWLTKGLGRGGAEQLLVGMVPYLDRDAFEVEVAYLLPWKDALVPAFEKSGVPVHCLENGAPFDGRWMLRLRELVRSREIGLVHTHMPYVAIGARASVSRSIPLVHTEHNLWDRYRPLTRRANTVTYSRNAAVIAVSEAVASSIRPPQWLPGSSPPVEVIRYGADLSAIRRGPDARAAARDALDLDGQDLVIGTVANFTGKKDHRTLLLATAQLVPGFPKLRVVLVGTGPLEAELRALVRELDLEDHVLFTGMRDDVYELLPAFDVFALSSRYEGLPISLLEAMATGIPCVTTRVGGIPEVISEGCEGRMVDPASPRALAEALSQMLGDTTRRLASGRAAARRAQDFDLATATTRTQEIYERYLAPRDVAVLRSHPRGGRGS